MAKKEIFWTLLVKAVKTLVILFTLFAIGWFMDQLPFAQALPFMSQKLPVGAFLNAVVSAFAGSLIKILALLFAYYAFQDAVFPFIRNFEWIYQSFFLGFTLFFLARAGLQIYGASEQISRFLLGALKPYKHGPDPETRPEKRT